MHAVEHSHHVVAQEESFFYQTGWWGLLYKSGFVRYSDDVIWKAES